MANEVVGTTPGGRAVFVRRGGLFAGPPVRLSWGAIFGGAIVAIAVWALLYSFGLAVGLTAVDPNSPNSLRASGIFTGIWSLVVPIVALFIGGVVASRGADVTTKLGGAIHGLIAWGLVTLAGAWLLTSILSSALAGLGMAAAAAGGTAMQTAAGPAAAYVSGTYDTAVADTLRPINARLQAEGRPAVRPEQVEATVRIVVQDALRQGQLNRDMLVTGVIQGTSLSRADAENVASRVQARYDELQQSMQTTALRAADATGKAFWGVFAVMLLSLAAALVGATIGVTRRQVTTTTSATASPPGYPHEPHEAHT